MNSCKVGENLVVATDHQEIFDITYSKHFNWPICLFDNEFHFLNTSEIESCRNKENCVSHFPELNYF